MIAAPAIVRPVIRPPGFRFGAAPLPSTGQGAGLATFPEWYARTLPQGWTTPRHIAYILDRVQDVVEGRIMRLAISLPPGHAKSSTITHRLPVFWGASHPGDVAVLTGYSQRFAEKHLSQPAREIAQELGLLASDATALDEWGLSNGARLVVRGVGNPPTGVNPISLIVTDDPIKSRAEAASLTIRDNVWQWWTGSIVQRFWPRTRVVFIATRWHEDDAIGRLKAQEAALPPAERTWVFINLPALAGTDDPLGRAPGEALWPEAKSAVFLRGLRQEMGDYEFEAVFQGNPTPREGATFKVSKLRYVDAVDLPPMAVVCRAWDLAATDGAGDYTAGVKIGRGTDGLTYVLGAVRGQWDSAVRNQRMTETAAQDGRTVRIRVPQDPGQAGKDQAGSLVRMLAGYAVRAAPVTGDKETRADPFAAQVNAGSTDDPGNVRLVRGAWNAAYVEELRTFPVGKHDDQVDASGDAFNEVAPVRNRPASTGRVESPYSY